MRKARQRCIPAAVRNEDTGMNRIPDNLWQDHPLQGRNLGSDRLATELGDSDTLLVFLRHLG